jgi:hypothetical protein
MGLYMEYILIRHNPLFSVIGHGLNTGIPGTVLVGLELITGRKNIRLYFVMGRGRSPSSREEQSGT